MVTNPSEESPIEEQLLNRLECSRSVFLGSIRIII